MVQCHHRSNTRVEQRINQIMIMCDCCGIINSLCWFNFWPFNGKAIKVDIQLVLHQCNVILVQVPLVICFTGSFATSNVAFASSGIFLAFKVKPLIVVIVSLHLMLKKILEHILWFYSCGSSSKRKILGKGDSFQIDFAPKKCKYLKNIPVPIQLFFHGRNGKKECKINTGN